MPTKKAAPKAHGMTAEHKEALSQGREDARAVRRYLSALRNSKPKRGRPVNPEALQARLSRAQEAFEVEEDPVAALIITQQIIDLEQRIQDFSEAPPVDDAEEAFVKSARSYSERKNITHEAWRRMGVPPGVLRQAGIS